MIPASDAAPRARILDPIDRKILALLQADATLSIAVIGARVGLSQTPCWKRIRRLEAEGVIERRVAVLDPDRLGLGLTAFVGIEAADHSGDWLDRFAAQVAAMPEILDVFRMAGDVDYVLRVVVPDKAAYAVVHRTLTAALPLKSVSVRFTAERLKATTILPIAEPAPR